MQTTTKDSAGRQDSDTEPVTELITDGSDTPVRLHPPQKTRIGRWKKWAGAVTVFVLLTALGRFWVVNHRPQNFVTGTIPKTQMALSIDYPGYWNTPQEHNTKDKIDVRLAPPYPPKLTVWLAKHLLHQTPPSQHGIHIVIQPNDPTRDQAYMKMPPLNQPMQTEQHEIHCPLGIAYDRTIIIPTRGRSRAWEIRSCQIWCDDARMSLPIAIHVSCAGMLVEDKQAQHAFDEIIQHLRLVEGK